MKSNVEHKQIRPLITIIPRPPPPGQQKVTPIVDEELYKINPIIHPNQTVPQSALRKDAPDSKETKFLPTRTTYEATQTRAAPIALSEASSYASKVSNQIQAKESSGGIKRWYSGLTSKQKKLLRVGIVVGALLACAILVILLVVFLVILRPSSTTATTTATSIVISASWTFDQTTADSYNVYNGTLMNGASYSPASTTQPYLGNGRALTLSAPNQSFTVSAPFFNLTYTSFTIETWIYSTNITGDRGIFSQCTCATCSNQCLYLILRSDILYADFTYNNLYGSTLIAMNTWYHIAFVYNYATKQQIWYVNGVQDGIASSAQPYQGTNGSIQIGAAQLSSTTCYFNGYIDNVKLITRAKSATEILYDASVTAYYAFDTPSLNNDNGPNSLNGLSNNIAVVTGRVNQAMRFSGVSSYFQAYGFYQLMYSISNQPFSVSLWINPSAVSSSTIVQITQQQFNGSCYNFIGITSPNGLTGVTGQLMVQGYNWAIMYGPFLTMNAWTHVSVTYSSANGIILYVNGIRYGSTGPYTLSTGGTVTWLQIGYNFQCNGSIWNYGYQGSIDEVYVHSRELTQADVTGLANP